MSAWDALESSLNPEPQFFVQAPDGRRDWPEIDRQSALFKIMHAAAPRVLGFAIPNAGKRNPHRARREHILGGVFDTQWLWRGMTAFVELKGFDARGRAGTLQTNQIEFGNRCVELGIPCAMFFCPFAAAEWLREQGFPVAEVRRAA
jgi:hypothetical protein